MSPIYGIDCFSPSFSSRMGMGRLVQDIHAYEINVLSLHKINILSAYAVQHLHLSLKVAELSVTELRHSILRGTVMMGHWFVWLYASNHVFRV